MTQSVCHAGKICTHEGPCHKDCGGEHYFHTDGTCLRCGKFEFDKSSGAPLTSKGRTLKVWNGRWGNNGRGRCYVAAYSQQDAAAVVVAAGGNSRGLINEIREYWSPAWGNSMDGIVPERGLWVSKDDHASPVRQVLNFQLPGPKAPAPEREVLPAFALKEVIRRREANEARARERAWYRELPRHLAAVRARVLRATLTPGPDDVTLAADRSRLDLLERLFALQSSAVLDPPVDRDS